jgi:hypothetical protein
LVEVNCYPIDLELAETFRRRNFISGCTATVPEAIIDASGPLGDGLNLLVLSPRYHFAIADAPQPNRTIKLDSSENWSGLPGVQIAQSIVSQYNAMANVLSARGLDWCILSLNALPKVFNQGGNKKVLFHRGASDIAASVGKQIPAQDVRIENYCGDKSLLRQGKLQHVIRHYIPTAIFDPQTVCAFVRRHRSDLFILKPRRGFGSHGVFRSTADALSEYPFKNYVIQPFVPSAQLSVFRGKQFELRVHAVSQQIVSVYAKIAAAPDQFGDPRNELGWCTAIGTVAPLEAGGEFQDCLSELSPDLPQQLQSIVDHVFISSAASRLPNRRYGPFDSVTFAVTYD